MSTFKYHPACLLFPPLAAQELQELAADIRQNGLLNEIVTLNGQVLDGRNRLAACQLAGVEPRFKEWAGAASPVEWVVSQNLIRRHLTSGQRAVVAFGLLPLLEADAKQRQRLSRGRAKKGAKNQATFSATGKASQVAARVAKTNAAYVEQLKTINAHAPDLVEAVRSGSLTVPEATELAKLTPAKRQQAIDQARNGKHKRDLTRIARQLRKSPQPALLKAATGQVEIWQGDCLKLMAERVKDGSISVVIASPPYNVGMAYADYDDRRPEKEYLDWLAAVFHEIRRVLTADGSFFLIVGSTPLKPWTAMKVAEVAGREFVLQNTIIWAKSITVEGHSYGQFSPMKGDRFLSQQCEHIFHFTKNGTVKLDRLAVGVPLEYPVNLGRNQRDSTLRCGGNVWFLPHDTIHNRAERGEHPCVFPVELPERCIRLHGIRKDTVVLDPFVGIGTTVEAAERLGVRGIGIELSAAYCDYARRTCATT